MAGCLCLTWLGALGDQRGFCLSGRAGAALMLAGDTGRGGGLVFAGEVTPLRAAIAVTAGAAAAAGAAGGGEDRVLVACDAGRGAK